MIASFFFIPASHPKLTEKIASIRADYLIIDIEDATAPTERVKAIRRLCSIRSKRHLWIRPVIFENSDHPSNAFSQLVQAGFRNFIIPKVRNLKQLSQLESIVSKSVLDELRIIILVENPECLINLQQIIEGTSIKIEGVGFGSQDYCTETGMKHSYEFLNAPRFQIMNTAKAYGLNCIDIACMDAHAGAIFQHELKETFEMGFDGKFLIHPAQLRVLQQYPFFSYDEVKEAIDIIEEYDSLGQPAVFVFNNKAIEPPHIKYFSKIIDWHKKHESK